MTHTGVDYFCCNRARGAAEVAAAETASALGAATGSAMRDFVAAGGRFPVVVLAHERATELNATLASLRAVRCVDPGDVLVVQDGTDAAVAAVVAAAGVRGHQRPTDAAVLAAAAIPNSPLLDGAVLIAGHYRYALTYAFDTAAPRAPAIIVAEEDLLFSPDFYEYFHAVAPALEADSSLWLASAWVRATAATRGAADMGMTPRCDLARSAYPASLDLPPPPTYSAGAYLATRRTTTASTIWSPTQARSSARASFRGWAGCCRGSCGRTSCAWAGR